MVHVTVSVWPVESVTWAVKMKLPPVVGVPLTKPVLVLRVRPRGARWAQPG